MSYCVSYGKDRVMFLTEDYLKGPSSIVLPKSEEPSGLLLPNGEINWGCPCLGNAAIGPCSVEVRKSLTCFHKSTEKVKGSDCLEGFQEMNDCMSRYPNFHENEDTADDTLKNLEDKAEFDAISSEKNEQGSNAKEKTEIKSSKK